MRITGIEPISSAWKADNLPLIYIRGSLGEMVNTTDLKSVEATLIGSSPIVSNLIFLL